MAIAFYSLGTIDVTGMAERQISPTDRKSWKEWIWDQYVGKEFVFTPCCDVLGGAYFVFIGCARLYVCTL